MCEPPTTAQLKTWLTQKKFRIILQTAHSNHFHYRLLSEKENIGVRLGTGARKMEYIYEVFNELAVYGLSLNLYLTESSFRDHIYLSARQPPFNMGPDLF